MGTGSFTGGKVLPGRDADPSPLSSAKVKSRVELYLYSPLRAFLTYDRVKPNQYQSLPLRTTFGSPFTSHPNSLPPWDFVNHTHKMQLNIVNTKTLSDEFQQQFLLWKKMHEYVGGGGVIWQYPSRVKIYYYSYRTGVFAKCLIKMHSLRPTNKHEINCIYVKY